MSGATNERPDASCEGTAAWEREYKAGMPEAREGFLAALHDYLNAGGAVEHVLAATESLIEAKLREFK